MQNTVTYRTWATLKPETPFNHLFPDGRVPIRSPLSIIPREEGCPLCYLVPGNQLTDEQIHGLAEILHQTWSGEATLPELVEYIRQDALPLKTEWFDGFGSTDFGLMMSLAEMGREVRQASEPFDDNGDFGWDYDDEEGGDRND